MARSKSKEGDNIHKSLNTFQYNPSYKHPSSQVKMLSLELFFPVSLYSFKVSSRQCCSYFIGRKIKFQDVKRQTFKHSENQCSRSPHCKGLCHYVEVWREGGGQKLLSVLHLASFLFLGLEAYTWLHRPPLTHRSNVIRELELSEKSTSLQSLPGFLSPMGPQCMPSWCSAFGRVLGPPFCSTALCFSVSHLGFGCSARPEQVAWAAHLPWCGTQSSFLFLSVFAGDS